MTGPGNIQATGRGLIGLFTRHPTAANLLMVLMLIAGIVGLSRLNTQFFPDFGIDWIQISVIWPGASADDAEASIVQAIEPEVRFLDDVKRVRAEAREGVGNVYVEFNPGADMQTALAMVENAVARITTLPEDAERPVVQRITRYDTISRLILAGPYPEASLKAMAKRMREDLLDRGVDRVTMFGARDEEIWVEVEPETLLQLDLTLAEIAARIQQTSQDIPSGETTGAIEAQIRALGEHTDARGLGSLEVKSLENGNRLLLRDIATVADRFEDGAPLATMDGLPAVELHIQRTTTADALESAAIVDAYIEEIVPTLPATLKIVQADVASQLIRDRINLLLRNGLGGLVLVLAVLFLFLNARVALWVAVGIPIAVMATLGLMLLTGQSINMISLFAMIMMIGIVVDDAIVVGEHAMARRMRGMPAVEAAETGARRMVAPVFSATLTTIAAFLPIMLVRDIIGVILLAIPLVAISTLIASLVECFLVLPGHLRHALISDPSEVSRFRKAFNARFEAFRDGPFRRAVAMAIRWRYVTLVVALSSLIVAVGMIKGGRVQFVFFPSAESDIVFANFELSSGTPKHQTHAMLQELDRSMHATASALSGDQPLIHAALAMESVWAGDYGGDSPSSGNHVGGMRVELMPSERRDVRTKAFVEAWRAEIIEVPGLESLTIRERQGGPPGLDIDIRLFNGSTDRLKEAATRIRTELDTMTGVSDAADDLPWGKQELILGLTARGQALGFTTESVGRQVRDGFEGLIAKRFARGDEEITIRVQLPRDRVDAGLLRNLYLRAPGGQEVPLAEIVTITEKRGFAVIRREDGQREVAVTAEVDEAVVNPTALLTELEETLLPAVAEQYDIDFRLAGKAEEQAGTFADMQLGTMIGLAAIYIILAWVFGNYTRPFVVMSIIPLALVGAVIGHWLTGYDLTILSMIGLLGLSGIVVNDSIILVSTISERMDAGQSGHEDIVDGACDRLRAVILTSLTTIGGLFPMMFETSLQAQFLKPMVLTLVFGLIATTLLVLFVVPASIAVIEDFKSRRASVPPKSGQKQDQNGKQLQAAE